MKAFLKRSAISIIVVGVAGSAYAAMPSNNTSWSPQFTGAFIGVEGLDIRPMNGDLDYATVYPSTSNDAYNTSAISTSYDWNWRVYGGIKFTDNDDITLSWAHMNNSYKDSTYLPGASSGDAYAYPRFFYGDYWDNITGRVTFDFDDAYAVWGHTINFNNPWSVRYAAGIEYAKLHSKLSVTEDSSYEGYSDPIGFEAKNETKGWGPRAELDVTYHLPYGFALFGNANAALLVSTRKISLNPTVSSVTDDDSDVFTFNASDFSTRHVVIPKFGMRLGASYSYVWGQAGAEGMAGRSTTLTVDAGWQIESFIHAIERPVNGFYEESSGSLAAPSRALQSVEDIFTTKTSNFGYQGLFVGVKLGTDWL